MNFSRIKRILKLLPQVDIVKFFYYNYFCPSVIRHNGSLFIPYKNSIVKIHKTARLNLWADFLFNADKLPGAKIESYLYMKANSEVNIKGQAYFYYNTTIKVFENATLTMGKIGVNTGSTFMCAKKIVIGHRVMLARGVFIYDSDFHKMLNTDGTLLNKAEEIFIGNHVWLGLKTTLLKGTRIGSGSVVSAHSWLSNEVGEACLVGTPVGRIYQKNIRWEA